MENMLDVFGTIPPVLLNKWSKIKSSLHHHITIIVTVKPFSPSKFYKYADNQRVHNYKGNKSIHLKLIHNDNIVHKNTSYPLEK
jgi:hypothetical protein